MWGELRGLCVCVSVYYKSMLHLIHVVLFTRYNSNCLLLAQTEQRSCTYATEQRETGKQGRLFLISCTCARTLT